MSSLNRGQTPSAWDTAALVLRNVRTSDLQAPNTDAFIIINIIIIRCWGLAAGYQPRPQVVDRGTTTRYGGQLWYKRVSSPDK